MREIKVAQRDQHQLTDVSLLFAPWSNHTKQLHLKIHLRSSRGWLEEENIKSVELKNARVDVKMLVPKPGFALCTEMIKGENTRIHDVVAKSATRCQWR